MAVGKTAIPIIEKQLEYLRNSCKELDKHYDTFQYVVNNIENWASETEVGSELRKDMMTLVECFQGMIQNTRNLESYIGSFLNEQRILNKD